VQELRLKHSKQTNVLLKHAITDYYEQLAIVFSFDKKYFISRCSGSYCRFSVPYMIVFSLENNAGRTVFFMEQIPLNAPYSCSYPAAIFHIKQSICGWCINNHCRT
jgi:hypothetical protein